jgi:release factor glutamine methyltransferase
LLLAALLKIDPLQVIARDHEELTNDEVAAFELLLERRLKCEPIAYILGTKEFFGLKYYVDSSVLIPRPETEGLVEGVLNWISEKKLKSGRLIDLGTGSGCIALSLASRLSSSWEIYGLDISDRALTVARKNSENLGLEKRVKWVQRDMLNQNDCVQLEKFSVVVSNPPYIPSNDLDSLALDIRKFEPEIALDGGQEGIAYYRSIFQIWYEKILANGLLALETYGGEQLKKLIELDPLKKLNAAGECRVWNDGPHIFIEKGA